VDREGEWGGYGGRERSEGGRGRGKRLGGNGEGKREPEGETSRSPEGGTVWDWRGTRVSE